MSASDIGTISAYRYADAGLLVLFVDADGTPAIPEGDQRASSSRPTLFSRSRSAGTSISQSMNGSCQVRPKRLSRRRVSPRTRALPQQIGLANIVGCGARIPIST